MKIMRSQVRSAKKFDIFPNISTKIQSVTRGVSTKSFPDHRSCAAIGPRGGDALWQRHDAECQSNVTLPFTSVC